MKKRRIPGFILPLLILGAAGASVWFGYPQLKRHLPFIRVLKLDGIPTYVAHDSPAKMPLIKHPYFDFKALPAFIVDNLDPTLVNWNRKNVTAAARQKTMASIKKNLGQLFPADLKNWGLYAEKLTGNAVLAGGLWVGAVADKKPTPFMFIGRDGLVRRLARIEGGKIVPIKWKVMRSWLWHKPNGQLIISVALAASPKPSTEGERAPANKARWTVLVNGIERPSKLFWSDVTGDKNEFTEKALVYGTIDGKEFDDEKMMLFLEGHEESRIGKFVLSPLVFRMPD